MILRDANHRYYCNQTGIEYNSISRVIRALGIAKSFAGMEFSPQVKHAIDRGRILEDAIFAAMSGPDPDAVDIPAPWVDELRPWIEGYWRWLDDMSPEYVSHRTIVGDDEARIAGEIDLVVGGCVGCRVVDIKCTAKEERDWILQVGGLHSMASYGGSFHDTDAPAVLHLNPKFAKGYIWREYPDALNQWAHVRRARMASMAAFESAKATILGVTA